MPIKNGKRTRRRTAAPATSRTPLGPEHALARQRRGEAVERQAEQLLDEGMGLGGAVHVDENPRVHAEALARLQGVGEHLQALRGNGEEDLVDDQVALQQLGQVAKAPDHRSVEHRGRGVRRVHAQAAAHDPARLRVAHESGDEAAGAVSRAHHEGDARPALAPPEWRSHARTRARSAQSATALTAENRRSTLRLTSSALPRKRPAVSARSPTQLTRRTSQNRERVVQPMP